MRSPAKGVRRGPADAAQTARLALGLLAAFLLIFNAGAWFAIGASLAARERMMETQLGSTAAIVAAAFPDSSLLILEASVDQTTGVLDEDRFATYAELPSAGELAQSLARVNANARGATASILSPDGKVVFAGDAINLPPVAAVLEEEDAAAFARAAKGESAGTRFHLDDPTKRIYHPIRSSGGAILGVLRLEAERPDTPLFERQVRRLAASGLVLTAIIVVLWVALSRVIRRAVIAERSAAQSDRLRALGTATAGIAHELRNPLGILRLGVEELRAEVRDLEAGPRREAMMSLLGDLDEETARLRDLTDQFLGFARPESSSEDPGPVDVAAEARRTAQLFGKGLPSNVRLSIEAGEGPLNAAFGPRRLRQILLNLMRNAQEALPETGGTMIVRTSREGSTAVLTVVDNGRGMDETARSQAFDPFFTTRAEGTGLGLALCRSLAEAAGGSVTLESTPGRGTAVSLRLPLSNG